MVALKGALTHIATPDGEVWRHDGGNVGLAVSGSGDVLAGIIAGLRRAAPRWSRPPAGAWRCMRARASGWLSAAARSAT